MDLTSYKSPKIKKLRFLPIDEWFTPQRDEGVNPRFWTILQESFHASYLRRRVSLSMQKKINWHYLELIVGGVDMRAHFEYIPGLAKFVSGVGQYVEDWVRVFYATVWIAPEGNFIQFMFQGESFRLYRTTF